MTRIPSNHPCLPESVRMAKPKRQRIKIVAPLRGEQFACIFVSLPFPPTVNMYWRMVKGKMLISKRGREYRTDVIACCQENGHVEGRLTVTVNVYPPDERRRDLDNLLKAILDSLQAAGLYRDDSQVDRLCVNRCTKAAMYPRGAVLVCLEGDKP